MVAATLANARVPFVRYYGAAFALPTKRTHGHANMSWDVGLGGAAVAVAPDTNDRQALWMLGELVKGESIRTCVTTFGEYDEGAARIIAHQVLKALQALHDHRLAHGGRNRAGGGGGV